MESDFLSSKGPVEYYTESDVRFSKSPQVEGISQGAKAALLAAPLAAAVQALRGKSPVFGAMVGGLGAAALVGLSSATVQKYRNIKQESEMRYHLRNLIEREPTVALPDPEAMRGVMGFSKGFGNVYNPY